MDPRKYTGELSDLRKKDLEKGNPRIAKYFDALGVLEERDYHKKYTVGNILTDSIKDILTSKESKRLISQIYGSKPKDKDLLCKSCTNFLTI